MTTVNEIQTQFSFLGNLKPLNEFNASLGKSIKMGTAFLASMGGAVAGAAAFTSNVAESIDPLVQLSRETGASIEKIQELGYAASQNGSSMEAVQKSVAELTKRAGEFARTGGGSASQAFYQLGVSVRDSHGKMKDANRIMSDVAGQLGRFSKAEQADLLDKLGIDASMIQVMNQSAESMQKLRAEAHEFGIVTEEQGDALASLVDSNTRLGFAFDGVKNTLAVSLAPEVKAMTDNITKFIARNREMFGGIMKGTIEAFKKMGEVIERNIRPLTYLTGGLVLFTSGTKLAALALKGATLALKGLKRALPFGAILAVVAIIDDLNVALSGGQSKIQELAKEFLGFDIVPPLQRAVDKFNEFTSWIKDSAMSMFDGWGDIFSGEFTSGIKKIMKPFNDFFQWYMDTWKNIFSWVGDKLSGFIPDWAKDLFSDDPEKAETKQTIQHNMQAYGQPALANNNYSYVTQNNPTQATSNSSSVNQNITMNITAGDAKATGESAASALSKQISEAKENMKRS